MFNLKEIATTSMVLFAVIDIVGSVPVVIDLRQKAGTIDSGKASIVAMCIMMLFLFLGDFEWRRSIRFYSEERDGMREHNIHILDNQFAYGLEFYGLSSSANLVISPATERAFLSLSLALSQCQVILLSV